MIHIGLGLGRIRHWHDGLGEFSRQLGLALAAQAPQLQAERGWRLHFHLPAQWHGCFGPDVGYLGTHTSQRWLHLRRTRFALWHTVHQHNRLRAPLGTQRQRETVHDLNFLHAKSPAKIERYRAIVRRRLAGRDAAIAITHHVAQDLAREIAPLPCPVTVIHNGATDLTGVAQQPVAGVDAQQPYLLHISRMAPNKNISALLDLAAAWPQMPLVLAGADSPYTAEVRRQIAQRGLGNVQIHLNLAEGQKAWLYAHCSGFLFPSLSEGFGLPPIEAMHFGKPVFLSRLTSLPEVGGTAAHYFDRFDGPAMRDRVQQGLAQRPDQAEAVAAHARRFSWTRCAHDHLALYGRLLDAAPGPA
ncbi:MAG: hypothetical protein CFE45_26920 [Burkholderiales bacterium PBB5]|nr:MAG: hypothetical protein CFE45_26920 [Burkholderiales bacterium PBB5]